MLRLEAEAPWTMSAVGSQDAPGSPHLPGGPTEAPPHPLPLGATPQEPVREGETPDSAVLSAVLQTPKGA